MDLIDKLKNLTAKIEKLKAHVTNEEATKTAFIMPFFEMLGYDVSNPLEFCPEHDADLGKKGEKVDYVIKIDNNPVIMIEAKCSKDELTIANVGQLTRYFQTTPAKISILTNGIIYKFFSDLKEVNKMDDRAFFEINLLKISGKESTIIEELKKFHKDNFNVDNIMSSAEALKYNTLIKNHLKQQIETPDDKFVDYMLSSIYMGVKTAKVKERFTPIIHKAFNQLISDIVRDKFEEVMEKNTPDNKKEEITDTNTDTNTIEDRIITTEEEMEGYYIVKSILSELIEPERIYFKDTLSYFGIYLDGKITKWICRLHLPDDMAKDRIRYIMFPFENKELAKVEISRVNDIYKYKDKFKEAIDLLNNR